MTEFTTSLDSPDSTTFALLRHGTTSWNEQKRIQGSFDSPLSPVGQAGIEQWASALAHSHYDRMVRSDLGRVQQTAEILNRQLHLPTTVDTRLREQHWGDWEGMTVDDVRGQFPDILQANIDAGWHFCPPAGESRLQVLHRSTAALQEMALRWPGQKILVVCHLGIITCVIYHIHKRKFLPEEKKLLHKDRLHTLTYNHNSSSFETYSLNQKKEDLG